MQPFDGMKALGTGSGSNLPAVAKGDLKVDSTVVGQLTKALDSAKKKISELKKEVEATVVAVNNMNGALQNTPNNVGSTGAYNSRAAFPAVFRSSAPIGLPMPGHAPSSQASSAARGGPLVPYRTFLPAVISNPGTAINSSTSLASRYPNAISTTSSLVSTAPGGPGGGGPGGGGPGGGGPGGGGPGGPGGGGGFWSGQSGPQSWQSFRALPPSMQAGIGIAAAGVVVGQGVATMDRRMDRNVQYGADISRQLLYMQQITGQSQQELMQQRQGLLGSRVDPSAIMGFQARTGYAATPQFAQSIEGLRHLTGYSLSTSDVLGVTSSMMNPENVNRQLMMMGQSIYNPGGEQRDIFEVVQSMSRSFGLGDAEVARTGRRMGSVTRQRMATSGVTDEMQELLFDYAQSQQRFEEAGGKGEYDPRLKEHRAILGDNDNTLAAQMEETDRKRVLREEKMFSNQMEAYVVMEKHQQKMVDLLTSIDGALAEAYGARARTRTFARPLGRLLQVGGAVGMAFNPVAGGIVSAIGSALAGGDPEDTGSSASAPRAPSSSASSAARDAEIMVPTYNKPTSLASIKQRSDFKSLHPTMQQRLLAMMRENPNVGFGGGSRSTQQQHAEFLRRHRRTDQQTNIFWDGSYWERVQGAPLAPPGRSMHEIGLAADLTGDLQWVVQNAARFGLKHFSQVNGEPWHVQPAELPNGRREYEGSGAPWGTDGKFEPVAAFGDAREATEVAARMDTYDTHESSGGGGSSRSGGGGPRDFSGMSISERVNAGNEEVLNMLGGGGSDSSAPISNAGRVTSRASLGSLGNIGERMTGQQVAQVAFEAGFRGQDLVNMVAIAKRESSWRPRAFNPNRGTNDRSYGLWQLNTLNTDKGGKMEDLMKTILGGMGYPINNTPEDFEVLYDPRVNARVAYEFYRRNGNTLRPWGEYKGQSNTYSTNVGEALDIVQGMGLYNAGDPMDRSSALVASKAPSRDTPQTVHVDVKNNGSSPQITIAPQITFNGAPQTQDLQAIASKVSELLRREVDMMNLRSA